MTDDFVVEAQTMYDAWAASCEPIGPHTDRLCELVPDLIAELKAWRMCVEHYGDRNVIEAARGKELL
jgi:hypothetical protein